MAELALNGYLPARAAASSSKTESPRREEAGRCASVVTISKDPMIQRHQHSSQHRNSQTARLYELWRAIETALSIALAISPLSLAAFATLSGA